VAPKIFGSSVWNLLHVKLLAPRILKWLPDIWKICAPLVRDLLNLSACKSHPAAPYFRSLLQDITDVNDDNTWDQVHKTKVQAK